MSLCVEGLRLYRLLSESNRPMLVGMEKRREAGLSALERYQSHVAVCAWCGARKDFAA